MFRWLGNLLGHRHTHSVLVKVEDVLPGNAEIPRMEALNMDDPKNLCTMLTPEGPRLAMWAPVAKGFIGKLSHFERPLLPMQVSQLNSRRFIATTSAGELDFVSSKFGDSVEAVPLPSEAAAGSEGQAPANTLEPKYNALFKRVFTLLQ